MVALVIGESIFALGVDMIQRCIEAIMSRKEKAVRFEYYKDTAGEWRWRLVHDNGNITGKSPDGYKNKQDMLDVLENIQRAISVGIVPIVEAAS